MVSPMRRVEIIGNGGGGKSTLAIRLSRDFDLPYHSVDPIQWQPGWVRAPQEVVAAWHAAVLPQDRWIIDGWGNWDLIRARFTADTIILVDHPLRVHLWWALKRQALSVVRPQPGGPPGCPLLPVTGRMLQVIWRVHRLYRPDLLALIAEIEQGKQIIRIHSPYEMRRFMEQIA